MHVDGHHLNTYCKLVLTLKKLWTTKVKLTVYSQKDVPLAPRL